MKSEYKAEEYSVEADAKGNWYIVNNDGFPVSRGYKDKADADRQLWRYNK